MDLVWVKLILTPVAITAIALAGRRWGPAVGGWVAGLPLTPLAPTRVKPDLWKPSPNK
jgi:hypothetical protein